MQRRAGDPPSAPTALSINILGGFTATRDGQPLDLGGRRQRAVLALLLLARGEVLPADRLVDALWGDEAPASAAGALQAYVSHLRRRLEPERTARARGNVIASLGPGYALRLAEDAVDAWRFEALLRQAATASTPAEAVEVLRVASALWRGPALADYAAETWARPEVARLEELRDLAREQLLAARLDLGETSVLVAEIENLVAEAPLREERWRLLVLALYRSHRQGDALGALRRARQVLADELGVDPGPALRALEAEVLAQSPSLQPTPRPIAPIVHTGETIPAEPVDREPADPPRDLVDRDRELAELRSCLVGALGGQAKLALVSGPAGIGKTRLLAEVRHMASAEGMLILSARGSQLEREYGFGAVRQLFESTVLDAGRRGTLLAGAAGSAASIFDLAAEPAPAPVDRTFAVLHGLYWLTLNLAAEQPLLLLVDDLQWWDTGSLRFLAYLTRRLEGLPVLIAGSLRTGEAHDEAALLAELEHDWATVLIQPNPLTTAGVGELVRQRLGDTADGTFIGACHRTTSGNPLLLRQLLRALETDGVRPDASHADTVTAIGSRAVSSIVLRRLARLPTSAGAVARAIAVLGDGAALPGVAALAELDEATAATAIAVLTRAEVVRDEHPLGFVHPLVRDAIYRNLSPAERALWHERAARVLETRAATAEQVAAHLLQIPHRGNPWVVEVLRRAARRAVEQGALEGAATYLNRALLEPPPDRPAVLLELGQVEAPRDGQAAAAHLREVYGLISEPADRAEVARALAQTLVFAGGRGEATTFARRAGEELPTTDLVDHRQALLALERISGHMHGVDRAVWRRGQSLETVGTGPGARMLASVRAWEHLIAGTEREECREWARFALADGVLRRAEPGLFWVVAAIVLEMAGEDIGTFWDDALAEAHATGSLFAALAIHLWRGFQQWNRGDLHEAYLSVTMSNEQSEAWGSGNVGVPYGDAFLIGILLDFGDVAGARALVDRGRTRLRFGDGDWLYRLATAKVLTAEGDFTGALHGLDRVGHIHALIPNPIWFPWHTLRAQALAGLDRRDEAIEAIDVDLAAARRWGAPTLTGQLSRIAGEIRGADGLEWLREAVALLSPTTARLEYARALFALARALPDQDDTLPMLVQALGIARRCRAGQLVRDIAGQLAAAGHEVPAELSGPAALTTSQRRIADLSLDGADERDIAQRLFITPRSVQTALEAIHEQLGVTSADDLRAALA